MQLSKYNAATPARILVVEDDPLDAELVLDELRGSGLAFESRRVDDEVGFRDALEAFRPDVIVSDLSMPGFSGERALDLLIASSPNVPFIYFSGTIGEESAIAALQRGATDYVLKNNPVRLSSAVNRALREAGERAARDHAEAGLVRAQRFESLGLLAGGISHDLRNILQPLLITADTIGDHDDPQVRKFASLVGECAHRGLEMVASMLNFARGARMHSEQIRIGQMFGAIKLLLHPTVPSRIDLIINKPQPDISIAGNQTELQQTLLNLCLNAIQSIPSRGQLTLSASQETLDDAFFTPTENARSGNYLRIDVSDTGTGMSDDVLGRLFTPFFTTKEDGTGLGMVSCQRIVANHHGYLRVESEFGVGTTVSIHLPSDEIAHAQTEAIADIPFGNGEHILLVIERASQLSLVCDALSTHGYFPIGASDGAQAIEKLEKYGLPAMLVMDAELSFMSGVHTLSALLEQDYQGPVLLKARPEAPPEFDDYPPNLPLRVINLPMVVSELLRAVHDMLRDTKTHSPRES